MQIGYGYLDTIGGFQSSLAAWSRGATVTGRSSLVFDLAPARLASAGIGRSLVDMRELAGFK
jgi:hypothetical protein